MARPILLAWEMGGGRGHAVRLALIAKSLRAAGFTPVFAVRRPDVMRSVDPEIPAADCHQAPAWPDPDPALIQRAPVLVGTVKEIFAARGLHLPGVLAFLLESWDRLLSQVRPAAIVADFSPVCLLAARGRVPTIAVGNGFTLPPAEAERLTPTDDAVVAEFDESILLSAANRTLQKSMREPLARLPQIFDADRTCVATFSELDPYHTERRSPLVAPFVPQWDRTARGEQTEIFAYLTNETLHYIPQLVPAITAVVQNEIKVRTHVSNLDAPTEAKLKAANVCIESFPVPIDAIATRSRLIISHGSLGMICCALASGIPQVTIPFDLENRRNGAAVAHLGVGRNIQLQASNPLEAMLLAASIGEAYRDEKLAARARDLAPGFVARLAQDPAKTVAKYVSELV